jgi:YVTN family beta-propeller protein
MNVSRVSRILSGLTAATVVALTLSSPIHAAAEQPYSVLTKWSIGGEGGWDYLAADPSAHRLYITHATRLEVLDADSGKQVGSITGFKGLHGVAFDNTGRFGYVTDGGANEVVVFDLQTLAKVASIPTGGNPDGMAFEPSTKTLWAFNGRSKDVTVIDTVKRTVVATLALPGRPEFPAVDGSGTVFVNIEDKNEVVRLDAAARKQTAVWQLNGCDSPSGLAIDITGHRLFSVCDGKKMVVTDSTSGKILATPAIGDGPDATRYDAARKLAISSNGDGTLTIIDAGKPNYPVLQTVATQRGARTLELDPANGRIYVVSALFGPRPAATADNPHPRPAALPGSFSVIVVGRK